MSLVFSRLSRFVIAFLSRSKPLLISRVQSPSAVVLEPKKQETSSSTSSILDYPEDRSIPLNQTSILDGRTSIDHVVISLSDMEPSLIESVGTKLEVLIADTVSTDSPLSEKDAAKTAREETGDGLTLEVLEVYRDTRKESEAELTIINLPNIVFDQTLSSVIACFSVFPLFPIYLP